MGSSSRQSLPDAGWNFDNSYARLPEAFHVRLDPVPLPSPSSSTAFWLQLCISVEAYTV
jgi:hypothetical protein